MFPFGPEGPSIPAMPYNKQHNRSNFQWASFFPSGNCKYSPAHTYRLSRGPRSSSGAQQSPGTLQEKKPLLTPAGFFLNRDACEQDWPRNGIRTRKDEGKAAWLFRRKEWKNRKKITDNRFSSRALYFWTGCHWKGKLWFSLFMVTSQKDGRLIFIFPGAEHLHSIFH